LLVKKVLAYPLLCEVNEYSGVGETEEDIIPWPVDESWLMPKLWPSSWATMDAV